MYTSSGFLLASICLPIALKAGLEVHISLSGLERGQLRLRTVKGRSWCTESEENINMQSVILLVVALHVASGAIHSWKAYYTGTTGLSEFPEFVALNLIDDQLMGYFDSNTNRFKSQFKWMEDNLGKNYDEQETNTLQGYPAAFKNNIKVVMERFNQTQGVHTAQYMYGCEWDDKTEETRAFNQHGYDGEDFVTLDFKEMRYISPVQQGLTTVQKWNNDRAKLEFKKQYHGSECIKWLKKYLQYGKSSLEKTVSPQVSLLQKDPSSPVMCHATGFYPSGVTISWMKNGQEHHENVDLRELLPNEDGTFQKTSTLRVTPDELKKNQFSCVVEHQGETISSILTEDKIRTNNDPTESFESTGIIIAVLAIGLLIVITVAAYMVYQKKIKSGNSCPLKRETVHRSLVKNPQHFPTSCSVNVDMNESEETPCMPKPNDSDSSSSSLTGQDSVTKDDREK